MQSSHNNHEDLSNPPAAGRGAQLPQGGRVPEQCWLPSPRGQLPRGGSCHENAGFFWPNLIKAIF